MDGSLRLRIVPQQHVAVMGKVASATNAFSMRIAGGGNAAGTTVVRRWKTSAVGKNVQQHARFVLRIGVRNVARMRIVRWVKPASICVALMREVGAVISLTVKPAQNEPPAARTSVASSGIHLNVTAPLHVEVREIALLRRHASRWLSTALPTVCPGIGSKLALTAIKTAPVKPSLIAAVASVPTHRTVPFASRIAHVILTAVPRKPAWGPCWTSSNNSPFEFVVVWPARSPMGRLATPMATTTTAARDCATTQPIAVSRCVAEAMTALKGSAATRPEWLVTRFGGCAVRPIFNSGRGLLERPVAVTPNVGVAGV